MGNDDPFETTRWSLVRAAAGDAPGAREALGALCGLYWYPLYAFIRRRGHGPEDAADLTQEFFARLIAGDAFSGVDPSRGRLRAFLLASCGHFLANRRREARALKRGGGIAPLSIDAERAEGRYASEPHHDETPEGLFRRRWALALLDEALEGVRDEYARAGKLALFEALRPTLGGGAGAGGYAEAASRLGLSPGAAQVAAHRLRKRFRAILRDRVAATVEADDVDDEIRDLFDALAV